MLVQSLFPGIPWVESPLFDAARAGDDLSAADRAIARDLNAQGFAVLDFPDADIDLRIERIIANLGPRYGIPFADPDADKTLGERRIQDAWLFDADVRAIATNPAMITLLGKLYGRPAFPFQTLNFPVGTQQSVHSDSLHFSSLPERFMCGVWLAMEDVPFEAGPLQYITGSHRWPIVNNAMIGRRGWKGELASAQDPYGPAWQTMIDTIGGTPQPFLAKKGQVLIWAANLLHGGAAQIDNRLTRWSQVTHYYFDDCVYYTPAFSDEALGRNDIREPYDIVTGSNRRSTYLGEIIPRAVATGPAKPPPRGLLAKGAALALAGFNPSALARALHKKSAQRGPRILGNVDAIGDHHVAGWAFVAGEPVVVEAVVDGRVIASERPDQHRPDVTRHYPDIAPSLTGFRMTLPPVRADSGDLSDTIILARPLQGGTRTSELARIARVGPGVIDRLLGAGDSGRIGPFPKAVIDALTALSPGDQGDLTDVAAQRAFADRLVALLRAPEIRSLPVFAQYARYLRDVWAHCQFVDTWFPASNAQAQMGAADAGCKPNSPREMLSIVHQLYVLKSFGIAGDFAEFGCFKGFSSAMLSHACALLGLKMHVFDSFEGLPPSASQGYHAGDYAGSLAEVRDHVTRFGAVDVVTFYPGFFADTFRDWAPPPLMCLWMDVDLEVSAQDLMVVADRLDPRATLFSHECTPELFVGDQIIATPDPDNPIPPVLDRFAAMDRALTGRFLYGNTGAFWPRQGGIPAMDSDVLFDLVRRLP